MKRCVRALIIGSVIAFGVSGFNGMQPQDARADEPHPNISECVSFRNDVKERSIVVRTKNECERKLTCSLNYAIQCEDNHGRRTSSSIENANFVLGPDGSAELVLSAERCRQAWTIDRVTWRCE